MLNKNFLYEQNKAKKYCKTIFIITIITQLIFLYFFTVVGKLDSSDSDVILKKYDSIIGLSSSITICVLTIYGAIISTRLIVCHFIGNSRIRVYLYPEGRGKLYKRKTYAFAILYVSMVLIGGAISNVIYFISEKILPIAQGNILKSGFTLIISPFIVSILSIAIIIVSCIVGIYFSSKVATIVASIIFIASISNLIAVSFMNFRYMVLFVAIIISLLVCISINIVGHKIDNDEVFYK